MMKGGVCAAIHSSNSGSVLSLRPERFPRAAFLTTFTAKGAMIARPFIRWANDDANAGGSIE